MQCTHYNNQITSTRCQNAATFWLHSPDGEKVPGSYVCTYHAQAVVSEYAAKLGQNWTAVPINKLGEEVAK